jgi:hypothetical protein
MRGRGSQRGVQRTVLELPIMNRSEEQIEALRIDLKSGIYSINEVRRKLGEPARPEPEADVLIAWTVGNGWVHYGTTQPVEFNVTALLPEAFNGKINES